MALLMSHGENGQQLDMNNEATAIALKAEHCTSLRVGTQ